MIESKQFAGGGMNQDVNENYLKPNEWQDARNIRVTDKLDGSEGVISNVKGNTEVSYTLPAGTNRCIGNYANEQTGKMYSFIWNSNGTHQITEYDASAGTITLVLQGSFLNFQQYELINGVGIVDGNLLYWTDGYNPPRSIDITAAKNDNTYYNSSASISLIKTPPTELIRAAYGNDPNPGSSSNRLKGQLFQFRYLYVYNDNTRSAWSSCSEVPLPPLEVQSAVNTSAYKNNNIILNFNVGDKFVKSVEIAAQVKGVAVNNTQDWFSILSVDRSELISNPKYLYDSLTNLATYTFFNDGLYQSVDIREVDLPYDFVPLKSKTLEVVNGNVLVLGNNTEGYDNISVDLDFNLTYETVAATRLTVITTVIDGIYGAAPNAPVFLGVPYEGDIITVQYTDPPFSSLTFDYTVTAETSGSLYDTMLAFAEFVKGAFPPYLVSFTVQPFLPSSYGENYQITWEDWTSSPSQINGMNITLNPSANTANSGSSYKTNSKYQFGLVYYDEFNRSSYVQTNDNCIVATSSWGASSGESPSIEWSINHSAPSWASKYQWVRSEQLTHKSFIYLAGTAASSYQGKYYDINVSCLSSYNVENPDSILSYSYTPGDRCTVHKEGNTWKTGYDVEVAAFDETTNVLRIHQGTILSPSAVLLLEVYTPKTRSNSAQDQFFYEFGESYSCSGGIHSAPTGIFSQGDIYVKDRVYNLSPLSTAVDFFLEDPNFSDFYISNYSSNGRTNIFAPQAKQLTLPTDIRYSDTYVPNTNINGLSRFYGDAYETYDRVNGSIQKLATRDNYLFCFQELKTGYIPVFQSIIEDQGAQDPNVAISTKLLNKIRYLAGDYGVGLHPESFARFAGTMYFADPNRGQVLKLTSGLQPISIVGMDKYFTSKLSEFNEIATAKIYGSYDPYNDEYIVTFKETSGFTENDQTIAWSEAINRWTTFYDFTPDIGGYIFNKYFTYLNARMYEHNVNDSRNSFYGQVKSSSISVVFNGSPAGIKTFLGLMNQSTTAWSLGDSIRTSEGQSSELFLEDFTEKEGVFMASFFKADNSPGGLFSGDALKGNWIKFRLSNGLATKDIIQALHMRFIPSNQGIK